MSHPKVTTYSRTRQFSCPSARLHHDVFAALPGQLNNTGLIRNVRQIRLFWTGRKLANTSQANFD